MNLWLPQQQRLLVPRRRGLYVFNPRTMCGTLPNVPRTDFIVPSGGQTVSTSGFTLENRNIRGGRLNMTAGGFKFTNCAFWGETTHTFDHGLLTTTNPAAQGEVYYCDFNPGTSSTSWMSGILGGMVKVRFSRFRNAVDAVGVFRTGLTAPYDTGIDFQYNWIENMAFFYPDPSHADGSHNDGMQFQGGCNSLVKYNLIEGYNSQQAGVGNGATVGRNGGPPQLWSLSCVLFNENVPSGSDMYGHVITDNLFAGGEGPINIADDKYANSTAPTPIVTMHRNRHKGDQQTSSWVIVYQTITTGTAVYDFGSGATKNYIASTGVEWGRATG